ncbi:MAG: SPFH domain-containing protein [Candidatus Acidiferrales bacterium]
MIFLKYLLLIVGIGFFGSAAALVLYDVYLAIELERLLRREAAAGAPPSGGGTAGVRRHHVIRWNTAGKLAALAVLPFLLALSIVVVPGGEAGVRVSEISGVRPGTLYPGVHFVLPLFERVALFDIRDKVFQTAALEKVGQKGPAKPEVLQVEAREGLSVGLAVVVRYRIDPRKLDYIEANLPQPLEDEIVAPVVSSAFRELAPNYIVRDVFSTKREEFRQRAAGIITQRLAQDSIVVKEVLLRKVDLPDEYAKGLEGLLLKEQEDQQILVEAQIEQKRVRIAESQAEAVKVRQVKRAEADAAARVIQAKAESDAMQFTLPLKQKQIEQTRLEAQARKEATIENAQAEAQAKVIDSKAEQQRQNLLADAEANRIRITSAANAEKMQAEAVALKANPLLVQKIIAERLSDKIQIVMVPADGKFFFANDVLRAAQTGEDPPLKPSGQR